MDRNSYEKLSITESAKPLKKYGSTSRHVTKKESYLKHFVTNTDTLQGIALKYDVTVSNIYHVFAITIGLIFQIEQIRRANKLWAADSLFLREYLLIPVPENKIHLAQAQSSELTSPSQSRSQDTSSDEENISEFLGKIDASIANTVKEVKKVQGNSE